MDVGSVCALAAFRQFSSFMLQVTDPPPGQSVEGVYQTANWYIAIYPPNSLCAPSGVQTRRTHGTVSAASLA
eukprot:365389-Chlamydomonas_euryale.AAC.9